jgi:hypothetical protein
MIWSAVVKDWESPKVTKPKAKAEPATHKICKQCQKNLPVSEFYSSGKNNGYTPRCKPCHVVFNSKRVKSRMVERGIAWREAAGALPKL